MPKTAAKTRKADRVVKTPDRKAGAAKTLDLSKVERVILYVTDFDRAVKFYRDTLGLKPSFAEEGWAQFETKGTELCLHSGREEAPGKHDACVGLGVADFDFSYAELKRRGVAMGEIHSPCGGIRCAGFNDPDGNRLGIEGK